MIQPLVGRQYRHYKGGLYTVTGLSKHSETLEDMVEYFSDTHQTKWARPLSSWTKPVSEGVERFALLPGTVKDPVKAFRRFLQSESDHQFQKGRNEKYFTVDSILELFDRYFG